jgi:hypothetical protein
LPSDCPVAGHKRKQIACPWAGAISLELMLLALHGKIGEHGAQASTSNSPGAMLVDIDSRRHDRGHDFAYRVKWDVPHMELVLTRVTLSQLLQERLNVQWAMLSKLFGRPGVEMAEYEDRAGRIRRTGVKIVVYTQAAFISMVPMAVQLAMMSIWIARIDALSKTLRSCDPGDCLRNVEQLLAQEFGVHGKESARQRVQYPAGCEHISQRDPRVLSQRLFRSPVAVRTTFLVKRQIFSYLHGNVLR